MKRIFSLLCLLLLSFNVSSQTSEPFWDFISTLKNAFNQTSEVSEIAIDYVRQDLKDSLSAKDPMTSLLGDGFSDMGLEEIEPTENEIIYYEKVANKILSHTNYKVISEEITGDQANVEVLSSMPNYLILLKRWGELFITFLGSKDDLKEEEIEILKYLFRNIDEMNELEMDEFINKFLPDDEIILLDFVNKKSTVTLKKTNDRWNIENVVEEKDYQQE
tara:strand:+ start:1254 stop:1910 length:657 start_codon:yes stop_codon:yes gene_type:complete